MTSPSDRANLAVAVKALEEIAAKHKALEGDIFCLTQPNKGGVFAAYDDLGIIAKDALATINPKASCLHPHRKNTGQARCEDCPEKEGEQGE